MATKTGPIHQHQLLHKHYGPDDCCLCRAEAALQKAGCPCCDGYHFPAGDSLVARLAHAEDLVLVVEARLDTLEGMYSYEPQSPIDLLADKGLADGVLAAVRDLRACLEAARKEHVL